MSGMSPLHPPPPHNPCDNKVESTISGCEGNFRDFKLKANRGKAEERQRKGRGKAEERQRKGRGKAEERQRKGRGKAEERQRKGRGRKRGNRERK
jgi:hypothetical protein